MPLATLGVHAGLLPTGRPFGFTALMDLLSLTGMQIKNAIVPVEEDNARPAAGRYPFPESTSKQGSSTSGSRASNGLCAPAERRFARGMGSCLRWRLR